MLKGVIKNETDSVDNSATNKQQQHVINQAAAAASSKSKASRKVSAHDSDGDESNSSGQNGGKLDLLAKAAETIGRDEDMSFESFKEFLEKNPDHQKVQNFLKAQSSNKRPKINSMLLLNNNNLNHLSDINQALDRQAGGDDKVMSSSFQQAAAAAAAAALMANSANGYRGASTFEEMKLHERQQQLNKLIQNSSNNSNSALLESLLAGKSSDSPNLVDLSLLQTLFNPNGSSPVHPSVYNVAFENHANYLLNSNHPSKNNSNHKSTTGLGEANANLMALNALAYAKSMSNGGQFMNAANPAPQHSASPGGGSSSPNSAANNNYPMFIGKNGKPTRPFKAYPREPLALPLGCTPALMQLQNPANNSNSNSHNSPSPGPSSKPSTGDRNKSNSPQSTPQVNTAAKPPAPPPNLNPLLSNPNLLVALQALLGQQQPAALSLENVLGVIAALTAASSSPPGVNPPASPTAPRQESPPTPAAAPSAADRGSGTMLAVAASDSTADLASSLLNNSDFSSSLDISSLSALTSSDFCTQYRKRIQQAQERLLHKQKQHQHQQQSDDSDDKSSTGKRRTSSTMRKRSSNLNLMANDYSNSESNSPTRFLEQSRADEQQAERAERFMKQLNESQSMNEHQLKQQQMMVAVAVDQGTAPGAESPVESDPRQSPTSSPDTTGEYMNYPPKKRLRMQQQQDSENKEKSTNELLNEPTTATSAEFAVTTTNETPQALKPESSSSKEFENDKAADELVDSTSTPPTVSNSRLFSNECLRLTRPASRYTPASTPTPLSLSISSSSSSTSGIGSCLSSSSPPLSSSSSVYSSSLTTSSSSSSSSCSSSISSDPNTLFNNNINIGNITSLVGHHISRQRTVHNNSNRTLTTTTATDPPSHSSSSLMGAATENNSNQNSSGTSRTINSRNSSTDDMDKDDAYKERRRKNNEAAKRSRDARRAKEDDIALRAAILERENLQLKVEVAQLKQETNKLRCMLYNS